MSAPRLPPGSCVVCGLDAVASLEPIEIRGHGRLACREHADVARATKPRSIAALRRACAPGGDRRNVSERRDTEIDRRAFWRPTPDRRAEATERGRRATDA